MDNGPFRMGASGPRERETPTRAAARGEEPVVAERKVEEPKVEAPRHEPVHHERHKKPKFEWTPMKFVIIAAVVAVLVIVLPLLGMLFKGSGTGAAIDGSKYQAVFFTNGQVYFGKLKTFNDNYLKLTDVFYLQTKATDSENPQETVSDTSSDVQLIKLGNEVHGPDDEMVISKDQILFFENLKKDGKVSTSISQYEKTK